VNADVPSATPDEALERRLLRGPEHVARCQQEDDRGVAAQARVVEGGGVLGRGDPQAAVRARLFDRPDRSGDRGVPEAGRLGEEEDAWLGRPLRVRRGGERRERCERRERREQGDPAGGHRH